MLVGPNKEAFYIHESVIRKRGTFFDAAFKKEWKEGQERVVELSEDDADHFRLYVQWLYGGKVFCKEQTRRNHYKIAGLYALGEKVLDCEFQDNVMNAMLAACHDENADFEEHPSSRAFPGEKAIAVVYEGTPANCPMRRLLVDYYVYFGGIDWAKDWATNPECVNHEFLIDLTKAMWEKTTVVPTQQEEPSESDSNPFCVYHYHGADEPCHANVTTLRVSYDH